MSKYISRKMARSYALLMLVATTASCAQDATETSEKVTAKTTLTQSILSANGTSLGSLTLEDLGQKGTKITVAVEGITPGGHAMHFHEIGKCEAPDFKSSGGHYNPTNMSHGHKMPDGPHAGDMMNVVAAQDGTGTFIVVNERVSINGDHGLPALLDADGTALVLHAGEDDYVSQPSGDADGRIGCAVVGG